MTEREIDILLHKVKLLSDVAQEKAESGVTTYNELAQLCAIETKCNEYLLRIVLHYRRKEDQTKTNKSAINHGSFITYPNKMMIH